MRWKHERFIGAKSTDGIMKIILKKKIERAHRACEKHLPAAEHENLIEIIVASCRRMFCIGLSVGVVCGASVAAIIAWLVG